MENEIIKNLTFENIEQVYSDNCIKKINYAPITSIDFYELESSFHQNPNNGNTYKRTNFIVYFTELFEEFAVWDENEEERIVQMMFILKGFVDAYVEEESPGEITYEFVGKDIFYENIIVKSDDEKLNEAIYSNQDEIMESHFAEFNIEKDLLSFKTTKTY